MKQEIDNWFRNNGNRTDGRRFLDCNNFLNNMYKKYNKDEVIEYVNNMYIKEDYI